jgi:hypothetical protein
MVVGILCRCGEKSPLCGALLCTIPHNTSGTAQGTSVVIDNKSIVRGILHYTHIQYSQHFLFEKYLVFSKGLPS